MIISKEDEINQDNNPFQKTTNFDDLWNCFETVNAVEENYKEKK